MTIATTLKSGSDCQTKVYQIFEKVVVTVTTTFKSVNNWTLPSLHKMTPMLLQVRSFKIIKVFLNLPKFNPFAIYLC